MARRPRIILKSGKDQSLLRLHPWVFSGAIKKIDGPVDDGLLVDIFNNQDEFMATGHYQTGSIAVRVLTFEQEEINDSFWFKRVESAYQLRKQIGFTNPESTNVFRLINAEGDYMPGLIADYYNGVVVTQFHSVGMYQSKESIISAINKILGKQLIAIYDKSESTMPFRSTQKPVNEYLKGNVNNLPHLVNENGCKFEIDWLEGQKTGFFIDQRENRDLLLKYTDSKRVLNMFCYTGGFSVYALKGNASLVHSVDSSKRAIEITDRNVLLNFPDTKIHSSFATDAFEYLEDKKEMYDVIILDPPAFAKHQDALSNALQGYKRLNQKAFESIAPGGILFTFSCSQVVSKENFRKSVFVAAANSGRKVSILHQLSQPADHPVSIYHPEGEYLKGLVCFVE